VIIAAFPFTIDEVLDLVPRLQAVVDELGLLDSEAVDVARALAERLLEEIEQARPRQVGQGTPLQQATLATLGELLSARERLNDDAYRAFVNAIHASVVRELERLAFGEALRARDES
jgi:hypothetical protein